MREARRQIVEYFGGVGFADLYRRLEPLPGDQKKWPEIQREDRLFISAAVLEDDLMEELGVGIWRILLSGATLRKQRTKHKNVKASDYLMLQRIVDGGLVYHDMMPGRRGTHLVGLAQDDNGTWWVAGWKKTKDGRELYFNTLYRVRERDLQRYLRKLGRPIKRRKK